MTINSKLSAFLRVLFTMIITAVATVLVVILWQEYMDNTWTRDGRIRVDTVKIAPDVSGLIEELYVEDNQFVHKGDPLFQIDKKRFEENLAHARSLVNKYKAQYDIKKITYKRRMNVKNEIVSQEEHDIAKYQLKIAYAQYKHSLVDAKKATLDLRRSSIYAPNDGWITNLLLKKGDYVHTGAKVLAMIQDKTFWVNGYFEENKIPNISIGDKAIIRPLGTDFKIKGHVQSIARGITDRDNALGGQLLANINPSFTWVRLAQRIPVRIHIDTVPSGFTLRAGTTCSIKLMQD
ncbi:MAG: HlyD family secretion protein [Sulfurimonas sp.]|nr:HlyD family secretion protein [Sulfurimonas sp.]